MPKKGFHILLGALELLRRRGTPFVADLVGGGPEFGTLANLVWKYGLSQNVRLWNFLTHAELYKFWCECDVFVQPSIVDPDGDRDGIPNVVIEALACGIPVAASDLPGIREVIRHEHTGFLCPPVDQVTLAACVEHVFSADCRTLGELGCQYGRDYTFVEDIIGGILAAATYRHREGEVPFEVFNLGNSQPVTLVDLLETIEQITGKQAIRDSQPLQLGDMPLTWAYIGKSEEHLGYRPSTPLKEGLKRFVDWYRSADPRQRL